MFLNNMKNTFIYLSLFLYSFCTFGQKGEEEGIPCKAKKNIDFHLVDIYNNPAKYVKTNSDDNCVIALVDSIYCHINAEDTIYFDTFIKIIKLSDGFLSEHLSPNIVKLFFNYTDKCLQLMQEDKILRERFYSSFIYDVCIVNNSKKTVIKKYKDKTRKIETHKYIIKRINEIIEKCEL